MDPGADAGFGGMGGPDGISGTGDFGGDFGGADFGGADFGGGDTGFGDPGSMPAAPAGMDNPVAKMMVLGFEALLALTPLGALAQGISMSATGKGVVTNLVGLTMSHMANNPNATAADALESALSQSGMGEGLDSNEFSSMLQAADQIFGDNLGEMAKTETFQKAVKTWEGEVDYTSPDAPGKNKSQNVLGNETRHFLNENSWEAGKGFDLEDYNPGETWSESVGWEYSLTSEEKALFDAIETNQINVLTQRVNESTKEMAETRIAEMINKGVWQGNIGKDALVKVYEDAGDAVAQGTLQLQAESASNQLSMIDTKYRIGSAMEEAARGREFSSRETAEERMFQSLMEKNRIGFQEYESEEERRLQATTEQNRLNWQTGENAKERALNRDMNMSTQEWTAAQNAAGRSWQAFENEKERAWKTGESVLDRKYGMDIEDDRADALKDANRWSAAGNVLPPLAGSIFGDGFDWGKLF